MSEGTVVNAVVAVSRRAGGRPDLIEAQVASPTGVDILVDIEAVGVCHADIAAGAGDFPVSFPIVLGHEGVGRVRAVGPDVRKIVPGDRVVLSFDSCGACARCTSGRPTQCEHYMELNFPSDEWAATSITARETNIHNGFFGQSSFSTVARASERNAVRVDTALPASTLAPLGCGVQTGAGAVLNVARPRQGDTVVVIGLGAVGFAALMTAKSCGVRPLIAVDVQPSRLELARELGVRAAIDAGVEDWVETLERIGVRVDIAIECSGTPAAFESAVRSLRPGGTAVVVGAPAFGTTCPLDVAAVVNNSLTIRGSVEGDSSPQEMVPFLVGEIESGRLPIDRLITEFAFADLGQALDGMGRGSLVKPVIVMPELEHSEEPTSEKRRTWK
jgi:aryl-alcohol dehydrogenase